MEGEWMAEWMAELMAEWMAEWNRLDAISGRRNSGVHGTRRLCMAASVESAANAPRPSNGYEGLLISHEGIVSSSLDWQQRGLCGPFLACRVGPSRWEPHAAPQRVRWHWCL